MCVSDAYTLPRLTYLAWGNLTNGLVSTSYPKFDWSHPFQTSVSSPLARDFVLAQISYDIAEIPLRFIYLSF